MCTLKWPQEITLFKAYFHVRRLSFQSQSSKNIKRKDLGLFLHAVFGTDTRSEIVKNHSYLQLKMKQVLRWSHPSLWDFGLTSS